MGDLRATTPAEWTKSPRAKAVDRLEYPDVTLIIDSATFIQLACGRIDPQAQIDSGVLTWNGDSELGDRAARNLRFTM